MVIAASSGYLVAKKTTKVTVVTSGLDGSELSDSDLTLIKSTMPALVRIHALDGMTSDYSGVIVDSQGYLLTVEPISQTKSVVELSDGRLMSARLVRRDPATEITVLKIEGGPYETLEPQAAPQSGEETMLIASSPAKGSPIWATRGDLESIPAQLAAATLRGDSVQMMRFSRDMGSPATGAVVLKEKGTFLGLVASVNRALRTGSSTEAFSKSLVIPCASFADAINYWIAFDKLTANDLGVKLADFDGLVPGLAGGVTGALITEVTPGSAAQRAGFVAGDVIVGINGQVVTNADNVFVALPQTGQVIVAEVKVRRGGQLVTLWLRG